MHKTGDLIRHEMHDVRNEDYYWLRWYESMEAAKQNRCRLASLFGD